MCDYSIGFKACDIGFVRTIPAFAAVGTPPEPVAWRLILVEVTEIVVVADNGNPIVAVQANTWRDQAFVTFAAIRSCHFTQFVPSLAIVVAVQDGENLRCFSPVCFGIGVNEEETAGFKSDDVGVFCESAGTSPSIENFVCDRSWMNVHGIPRFY